MHGTRAAYKRIPWWWKRSWMTMRGMVISQGMKKDI